MFNPRGNRNMTSVLQSVRPQDAFFALAPDASDAVI
jgi:hypothetical protein